MGIEYTNTVWDDGPSKPTQRFVLLALAEHASHQNESRVWLSLHDIAEMTGFSERTVRYALRALESEGWVRVVQRGGGTKATTYRMNFDPRPRRRTKSENAAESPGQEMPHPGQEMPLSPAGDAPLPGQEMPPNRKVNLNEPLEAVKNTPAPQSSAAPPPSGDFPSESSKPLPNLIDLEKILSGVEEKNPWEERFLEIANEIA